MIKKNCSLHLLRSNHRTSIMLSNVAELLLSLYWVTRKYLMCTYKEKVQSENSSHHTSYHPENISDNIKGSIIITQCNPKAFSQMNADFVTCSLPWKKEQITGCREVTLYASGKIVRLKTLSTSSLKEESRRFKNSITSAPGRTH